MEDEEDEMEKGSSRNLCRGIDSRYAVRSAAQEVTGSRPSRAKQLQVKQ